MSDVVKREVFELVDKELKGANEYFPLFNSNHEAFAVLLEEIEEAKEEATNLEILANNIWIATKENQPAEALFEQYTEAYRTAIDLAVEAIQAAAMARKGIISNIEMRQIDRMEGGARYE